MAGAEGREYSDAFLRFGMAFVGGRKQEEEIVKVRKGDRIALKRGKSALVAAGVVVERGGNCCGLGGKPWLEDFDGWSLPGWCYVDWHIPPAPIPATGFTRYTIQGLDQQHLRTLVDDTISKYAAQAFVASDPKPTERVSDNQLLSHLISEGLRPAAAEDLLAAFGRIRLLARYYYESWRWSDVREHETRSFLVMPLLIGLGWAEQQLKIELPMPSGKRRIDTACFSKPYFRATSDDCILIIEAKDFNSGLDYAHSQGKAYAADFANCRMVVATNGYCYKAYDRINGSTDFSTMPSSYLNILDPRTRYPLDPDHVGGSLELLSQLLP
jgi:hypothetical protein